MRRLLAVSIFLSMLGTTAAYGASPELQPFEVADNQAVAQEDYSSPALQFHRDDAPIVVTTGSDKATQPGTAQGLTWLNFGM